MKITIEWVSKARRWAREGDISGWTALIALVVVGLLTLAGIVITIIQAGALTGWRL